MLKETLKNTPLLGPILKGIKRLFIRPEKFIDSKSYWENRYKKGGNSGAGSYNRLAEFKAEVINTFVVSNKIDSVIEFGCGDGNQLKYFHFKNYIGIDVSETIISQCQILYKSDSDKAFMTVGEYSNEKADLTMSLDVIYHLVEDSIYNEYMNRLFSASTNYVLIYSSNEDDHVNNDKYPHVHHRKFTKWIEQNAKDFELIEHIPNKFPFSGNNDDSSYADFYIFKKK